MPLKRAIRLPFEPSGTCYGRLLILQRRSNGLGSAIHELGDEIERFAVPINARLQRDQMLGGEARGVSHAADRLLGEALAAVELLSNAAQQLDEGMRRRCRLRAFGVGSGR